MRKRVGHRCCAALRSNLHPALSILIRLSLSSYSNSSDTPLSEVQRYHNGTTCPTLNGGYAWCNLTLLVSRHGGAPAGEWTRKKLSKPRPTEEHLYYPPSIRRMQASVGRSFTSKPWVMNDGITS